MSQRQAAAALGVSLGTVNSDLAFNNRTESVQELNATHRDAQREALVLNNEAPAMVSAEVHHLVDEIGVVRKPSMLAACQALLVEIKRDRAAVTAAMRRGRGL
jgi:hypothetical protein